MLKFSVYYRDHPTAQKQGEVFIQKKEKVALYHNHKIPDISIVIPVSVYQYISQNMSQCLLLKFP